MNYFHSIFSLLEDHAEWDYLLRRGSDFSRSCSQKVGFGDVFHTRAAFVDGPVSVDSAWQGPPGVS